MNDQNFSKISHQTDNSLEQRAALALDSKNYKDAIALYTELNKSCTDDSYQSSLENAYFESAKVLANEGRFKEAVATLDEAPSSDGIERCYLLIYCLIKSECYTRAVSIYSKIGAGLTSSDTHRLESLMALFVISGKLELLHELAESSKVKIHYASADSAINAFCEGSDHVSAALKQIPFTSPYRDLRLILSALSNTKHPREALHRLRQIDMESPFRRISDRLSASIKSDNQFRLLEYKANTEQSFDPISSGYNDNINDYLQTLPDRESSLTAFLEEIRSSGGGRLNAVRPLLYRWLPRRLSWLKPFEECFGTLSSFDRHRFTAIAHEIDQDDEKALSSWQAALDVMDSDPKYAQNNFARALVIRRAAECATREYGYDSELTESLLEDSLDYDDNDLPTYQKLMDLYKSIEADENYRLTLNRALQKFPAEPNVLIEAIENSIEQGQFDDGARFAKRLLKLDSLNNRARLLLINAHLAQANTQILNEAFDLAMSEIQTAEKFQKGSNQNADIAVTKGLLEYARNKPSEGERWIENACSLMDSCIRVYFRAVIETNYLDISASDREKYIALLKASASETPNKREVLNLVADIRGYQRKLEYDLTDALSMLKRYFYHASSLAFNRDQFEFICDCFENIEAFQILMDFASRAVERWPKDGVFLYFQVFASTRGMPSNLTPFDSNRLEQVLDESTEKTSARLARKIMDFYSRDNFVINMTPNPFGLS